MLVVVVVVVVVVVSAAAAAAALHIPEYVRKCEERKLLLLSCCL